MKDVVVIGGGLSGLTLAFYLKRAGKSVLVVEELERTGGQIDTGTVGSFHFEKGPNTGVISSPEVMELFEDLQFMDHLEVAHSEAKCRLIWKGDRFRALPSGLISAVTTPLFTLKDKFRVLGEPFRARGGCETESLADLVKRRLGKSFLNYAVDPFLSGIYAGDPEKLITKYAMPKLYALEQNYGGFVRGAIAKAKEPKNDRDRKATKEIFSVKGGLSTLTDKLKEAIGEQNIILGAKNATVEKSSDGNWIVRYVKGSDNIEISSSNVVSTVGAYRLTDIFAKCNFKELPKITSLVYAPIVQASVGVEKCDVERFKAFGGLIPSIEKRSVLGILYPSACFDNRAPKDGMLFSFFIGGVRNADICSKSDAEIEAITRKEFVEMLKLDIKSLSLIQIFRYPHAIPQYDITQGERLEAIKSIESQNIGLYLAGNMRDGIGMPDRIKQASRLAKEIICK